MIRSLFYTPFSEMARAILWSGWNASADNRKTLIQIARIMGVLGLYSAYVFGTGFVVWLGNLELSTDLLSRASLASGLFWWAYLKLTKDMCNLLVVHRLARVHWNQPDVAVRALRKHGAAWTLFAATTAAGALGVNALGIPKLPFTATSAAILTFWLVPKVWRRFKR